MKVSTGNAEQAKVQTLICLASPGFAVDNVTSIS